MTKTGDAYDYIAVFIGYLEDIFNMLMKLFKGSDDTTTTTQQAG